MSEQEQIDQEVQATERAYLRRREQAVVDAELALSALTPVSGAVTACARVDCRCTGSSAGSV